MGSATETIPDWSTPLDRLSRPNLPLVAALPDDVRQRSNDPAPDVANQVLQKPVHRLIRPAQPQVVAEGHLHLCVGKNPLSVDNSHQPTTSPS